MPPPLRILFFATARQAVGRARLERPVPEAGIAVSELLHELVREYPPLGPIVRASRLVKNGEYLRGQLGRVGPGDELAVHPPYSGG
jgi:molybdopterin converting factor small subunit